MNKCLCCDSSLLRHIRKNTVYWYCPSCRQEMLKARSLSTCQLPSTFRLTLAESSVLLAQ